ncbi:hypothetical protein BJ322DRAFT_90853 [Thelephora terrestris]|uniref:Uncharacterized protein n=1 Tax=Thelephora terrestris TaxID=56493 RepID=A0A9P6HQU8_9AGAM|nr:hypothetical protein BJ322DRAFT_90853 [Thelephora terrestris]
MHPADFCEHCIRASLSLIFLSNSTLALLLGIPYNGQRHRKVDQLFFDQEEFVQLTTSSVIVVLVSCLFLCRVSPYCRFRVPKVLAFVALTTLSVLGMSCLTTYGRGDPCCESGGSQNSKYCCRPDIYLSLAWFSTVISLAGLVASSILHLCDNAAYTRPRTEYDGTHPLARVTKRESLELAKMRRTSNGQVTEEEVPTDLPPPPYEPSPTLLSSYVLPSIPLRKRDMNKLGLSVITDLSMGPSLESSPLETIPRKRWRGRGRDAWERKPLGGSETPERV